MLVSKEQRKESGELPTEGRFFQEEGRRRRGGHRPNREFQFFWFCSRIIDVYRGAERISAK